MPLQSTIISVGEASERSDRIREQVAGTLNRNYKDTRTLLLRAYLDLAMEHHEAITLLVRMKLFGPAFSLVRVVCEILLYALWVKACATENDVEGLALKGDYEFPRIGTVISALDKVYGTEPLYQGIKKQSWKAMSAYTHTGLLQLAKRFKEGQVEPNDPKGAISECLEATTMSIFLLALLFAKATGQAAGARQIEELLETFVEGSR